MKVYQILLVVWFVVFFFWLFRQFAARNKREDEKLKREREKRGGPEPLPIRHPD